MQVSSPGEACLKLALLRALSMLKELHVPKSNQSSERENTWPQHTLGLSCHLVVCVTSLSPLQSPLPSARLEEGTLRVSDAIPATGTTSAQTQSLKVSAVPWKRDVSQRRNFKFSSSHSKKGIKKQVKLILVIYFI